MQFNIGMCGPSDKSLGYLRVGLAWNIYGFGRNKVNSSLESFRNLIREVRSWDAFVKTNRLEIEWIHHWKKDAIAQTQTNDITEWLLQPPLPHYDWILIGRLLRRDIDTVTLADPARLKNVIDSVFSGFLPLWEETQYRARAR